MAYVALRVTATYQIQISDEDTRVHIYSDKVTNIRYVVHIIHDKIVALHKFIIFLESV